MNLSQHVLAGHASATPDRVALIELADTGQARRWSYAELQAAVLAIGHGLGSLGLARGERVVLRLGNQAYTPLVFLAAMAVGLVPVPTSHLLTDDEVAFLVDDCGAAVIVVADDLPVNAELTGAAQRLGVHQVEQWLSAGERANYAATADDDPAYLTYTSGTESSPKGVVHAHRSVLGREPMHSGWQGLAGVDVLLHAGALSWTYTLGVGLLDPWAVGATAVVFAGERHPHLNRDGTWWRLIAESGATIFAAVPGVYRHLLSTAPAEGQLGTLRHGLVAGEALTPDLLARWRASTGLELYESLGMSEISTFISSCPPSASSPGVPTLPGSPGKPQPGRHVAVLPTEPHEDPNYVLPQGETGLLAVRRDDPGLMLGYWNRPQAMADAFRGDYFVSGDLVHIDAAGYLHHHGRADDVINAGGNRVSPAEIERVLTAHPEVAEAAAVELSVRPGVSVVRAVVVPTVQPGGDALADRLRNYAAEHLARYKCPRQIDFVSELPRTANGKIQRSLLREKVCP